MLISRLIVATTLAFLPFACSSSGGPSPGVPAEAGTAGDAGNVTGVTCGGKACTLPIGGGIERLKACCTDAGACGLKLPGVASCLPRDLPGSPTAPECPRPTFKTPGGDLLARCCGPSGCGAMDPFLGCVPGPELGDPATSCAYDPTNDCTGLIEVTCDGAEDCPTGQLCCGKVVGNVYAQFGCFDSCAGMADGGSPFRWLQLCHAGDKCETSAYSCLASIVLPAPLSRCDSAGGGDPSTTADKSAHHVDCGTDVCGAGEKCCVRPPHAPYCAKASEPCECHPTLTDAGSTDSGAGKPDASSDAASVLRDAAGD